MRERIAALRANGVGTLVLDECHHLASLWGYAVRTVVEELGDLHVVGLTATPPDRLSAAEAALYEHLLGPIDFTLPTPAVVRDGHLAPFQELAWLTQPLDAERRWLAEHDLRLQELVTTLHADLEGPLSFPAWVLGRLRHREDEAGQATVGWAGFQRRHRALARAGARFIASAGLSLPPDVPRGEGYREQPDLDDWLVLLQDYALRCLRASPLPQAAERDAAIAAALRDLGFTLTRRGIRRGRSDVDRLLTASAAKPLALDLAALAVRDAYLALGELSPGAGASLAIEPRASGYLRVWLRAGTPEESARLTDALGELLAPPPTARYLVSRLTPGPGRLRALARALTLRRPFQERWHGVPSDLGRNKDRATAFAGACARWLGPSRLVFSQREEGRAAGAEAGAETSDYEVRVRRVWR